MRKRNILHIGCILLTLICAPSLLLAQQKSYKRGISYNIPSAEDIKSLSDGLSWYYNWGYTASDDASILEAIETYKLDFIPMTWGKNIDKERLRTFYQKNPQIKYILGFNEPNFLEQANIGPKDAAARWHEIEEIADEFGLKIIGPAMNYAPANGAVTEDGVTYSDPFKYLDAFFEACPDCRIDYVAAHCYMNQSSALKWYLSQYKKYGKPIWLTEFCAWENNVTPEMQKTLLVEALNYLESDPDIYRYSWFIGRTSKTGEYPYMQLLGKYAGQLTDLGKIYVNLSSFSDNIYATNDTVWAKDYSEVSEYTHLDLSTDESGVLTLSDFYGNEWTSYNIEVEEDGEYYFRYRVATQFEGKINLYLSDNLISEIAVPITGGLGNWKTLEQKIILNKGVYKIKLQSAQARINFNWWILSKTSLSGINSDKTDSPISIYPNPMKDILHISGFSEGKIVLADCLGKKVIEETNNNSLDVSHLVSGIYFLTLTDKSTNQLATYKIIK